MRIGSGLAAMLLLPLLASCVAPREASPAPMPRPVPPPPRPPIPSPAPVSDDWRDLPLSPGAWSYATDGTGSSARFGPAGAPSFVARCALAARTVTLSRPASSELAALFDITTSAGRQTFRAQAGPEPVGVSLSARDPFLDKMAFSRGRFVVAVSGTPRLVIPAWAEFARVVEDCRG